MTKVEFKFDLFEHVDTPLVAEGIITMLGVNSSGTTTYYVENSVQGVANDWWNEAQLASTAERVAQEEKV